MTREQFVQAFRERHRWSCLPGAKITEDLENFAEEHANSGQGIGELYELFCQLHGLRPKIGPRQQQ